MDQKVVDSYYVARFIADLDSPQRAIRFDGMDNWSYGQFTTRLDFTDFRISRGASLFYGAGDYSLLVIGGVLGNQADQIIAGWAADISVVENGGMNEAAFRDARDLLASLNSVADIRGKRLVIGGHSAGGIIAEAFVNIARGSRPYFPQTIYKYGSPCACVQGRYYGENTEGFRHFWVNSGDPVPMLPFTRISSWYFALFGSDYERIIASAWRQPSRILLMNANGQYGVADFRAETLPFTDQSISDWWASIENGRDHPHSIQSYVDRLKLALDLQMPQEPDDAGFQEQLFPDIPFLVQQAERFSITRDGPATFGIVGPDDAAPIAPIVDSQEDARGNAMPSESRVSTSLTPRIKLSNGKYVVLWFGRAIAVCDTFSRAKNLAARIRRVCRTMGGASSIESSAYLQGWKDFTLVASQPNQGVKPPLVVR